MIRQQLQESPSWNAVGERLGCIGVEFDKHIRLLLDGSRTRFVLAADIDGFHQIGEWYRVKSILNNLSSALILHASLCNFTCPLVTGI